MFASVAALVAVQTANPDHRWINSGGPLVIAGWLLARWWARKRRSGESLADRPVVPTHPKVAAAVPQQTSGQATSKKTAVIEQIRALAGTPPRDFDSALRPYLQVRPPSWLRKKNDKVLIKPYKRQAEIRRNGLIVWATIVQANNLLFRPGPLDHPASIVYAEDETFDQTPQQLKVIAAALSELKGTKQADAEAAEFARVLTDETIRAPRLRVPSRFTGRAAVYHTSILFPRKHLPQGYLSGSLFPIWLDPSRDGAVLLVPAAFWPDALLQTWRARPPVKA